MGIKRLLWIIAIMLMAATCVPGFAGLVSAGWNIQKVDGGRFFERHNGSVDHALAVGPEGTIYTVYGQYELYLAIKRPGEDWRIETIDETNLTEPYSSLGVDAQSRLHITYQAVQAGRTLLKYARFDGREWHIEVIDSGKGAGMSNSIALDSAGNPHVSYLGTNYDLADELRYAYFDGSSWRIERIDTPVPFATIQHTSLALDAFDRPHIGYLPLNTLKYAYFDGMSWHTLTVESGLLGDYTSLKVDRSGRPHVAYLKQEGEVFLKYARFDGKGWMIEPVPEADAIDSPGLVDLSLALDAEGRPAISYGVFDRRQSALKYAHMDGGAWLIETVKVIMPEHLAHLPQFVFDNRPN